jgi:hypothetical protein
MTLLYCPSGSCIDIHRNHSGTACNQFQSYRSADTRRATCNNNHLTV